jgi:dTDP-4-dehydrorhamnose 3,5-epimerase
MNIKSSQTPFLIKGGEHLDERGKLSFVNDFSLEKIMRFYTITHSDTNVIRAWQGHKKQPRYFYVASGSFWIACVKIDDWLNPSKNLKVNLFQLNGDNQASVLYIPPGFANGIKAIKEESKLISFCEDLLNENSGDNYRYNKNMWLDWNIL